MTVNKETEIKLRISPEMLQVLKDHPLIKKRAKSAWERLELHNQYFDTPQRELSQARVALRIRKDGEQLIQTLKSRGTSVAGLSERNEWDWPLEKNKLDLKQLDDSCWPASLAELDKKQLKAIFSTDFVREKTELAWGRGKTRVVIEAALDVGQVKVGKHTEALCELELELRQGEAKDLLELANELAQALPLMPCDISKAERGYRLFDANSYNPSLDLPALEVEHSLDANLPALIGYLLGRSQRLAEQYRYSGHWLLLQDWVESLVELRALLSSLGQAAPRASTHSLREQLDALLADWRPLVQGGQTDDALRQQAPLRFTEELEQPRWGQFSLNAALWLINCGWRLERNQRGERQGAAQLGNWLMHLLREEAQALQLKRYQQQPEDLAEQLPRIERIQVWLHLARHLLELTEVNRLYGEMRKLQALAHQAIDPDCLEQRVAQAHTVWTLKAWKELSR